MNEEYSNIRERVLQYVSDMYHIPIEKLTDDFDLHKYLLSLERVVPPEDYLFFWDDFAKDFSIEDEALTFDAYWTQARWKQSLKPIARLLFGLGIIGPSYEIDRITVGDLVESAVSKRPASGIKRTVRY